MIIAVYQIFKAINTGVVNDRLYAPRESYHRTSNPKDFWATISGYVCFVIFMLYFLIKSLSN